MPLMRRTLSQIALVAVALLFSIGLQALAAWTAPTQAPPQGNADAPLNTSNTSQQKAGNLLLNSSGAFTVGLGVNGNVAVTNGDVTDTNGTLNIQQICLSGVCRTTWPTASGGSTPPGPPTTFSYIGGFQTYPVPAGVTSVKIQAWGAQGTSELAYMGGAAGEGGEAQGTLAVTPGQVLYVYVGGQNGWNGGGSGTSAAGGASDVRTSSALTSRVIVAGGGGSGGYEAGNNSSGGPGGGLSGGPGGPTTPGWSGGPGGGGTQTAGGLGGSDGNGGSGNPGGYGYGGAFCISGGGGYYGGGGSGAENFGSAGISCGASGGGSGYIGGVTGGSMQTGVRTGDGEVIITPL